MRYPFKNPKFIVTAMQHEKLPKIQDEKGREMDEIAVAGRSNVGKSSLLNHLFHHKGLVKTSATPGKTQALNLFTVDDALAFVDLPGYGFAKVPQPVRKKWGPMVQGYLENRRQLKLVLFLFDIRRMPTEEDLMLLDWIIHAQKAAILVLTKVDKVKANEKKANTDKILKAFDVENLHYTYFSSTKKIGRNELIALIHQALASEK